jgi:hypothetical protein
MQPFRYLPVKAGVLISQKAAAAAAVDVLQEEKSCWLHERFQINNPLHLVADRSVLRFEQHGCSLMKAFQNIHV